MRLWKFACGYVKISLECYRPEQIVNILLGEDISVHNARRISLHKMIAVISLRDYQRLCAIAETYDCIVTVLAARGLPVCLKALLSRPLLIFSIALWLTAGILLSRRVLIINVEGCDAVSEAEILSLAESMGVKKGVSKRKVDREGISRALLACDGRVGFADTRLNGVVLTFFIREVDKFKPPDADNAPSSVYADKDCVIIKLFAKDGKPMVKPGQAVKRGELLISGDITPERGEYEKPLKIAASGTILGQTAYRFSVNIAREQETFARSGKSSPYTEIEIFGFKLASKLPFPNCEPETLGIRRLTGCGLPVKVESGVYYELLPAAARLSDGQMIETAKRRADALILKALPKDARLIMRSTVLRWNGDGSLTMTVILQTIEEIGYSRYI